MTAEIIPLKDADVKRPVCCFCRKEIPKGTMALRSTTDPRLWMCGGCIQEATIRMGVVA